MTFDEAWVEICRSKKHYGSDEEVAKELANLTGKSYEAALQWLLFDTIKIDQTGIVEPSRRKIV